MLDISGSTALLSAVIAVSTFVVTYRQGRIAHSRARRKVFDACNRRFNKMNEDLNAICEGRKLAEGKTAQNVIQDYLNLCAEEYLALQEGLVSKRVWRAWMVGMNYYILKCPLIAEVFGNEKEQAPHSYYGLFDGLKLPAKEDKTAGLNA